MIAKDQAMPLLLEACPSFRKTWDCSDNQDLPYVCMGDLARHLLHLHEVGRTGEFPAVCEVIERLLLEGDGYVKELATLGFLEGVQNVWLGNNSDPEEFFPFLLPESRKWWQELNDYWQGKTSRLGSGRPTKRDADKP